MFIIIDDSVVTPIELLPHRVALLQHNIVSMLPHRVTILPNEIDTKCYLGGPAINRIIIGFRLLALSAKI